MKIVEVTEPGKRPAFFFATDDGRSYYKYDDGVRELRRLLGMAMCLDLANAIGYVSARTVENWEQGRNAPQAGAMAEMRRILDAYNKKAAKAETAKHYGIFTEADKIIGIGRTEKAAWRDAQARAAKGVTIDSEEHAVEPLTNEQVKAFNLAHP